MVVVVAAMRVNLVLICAWGGRGCVCGGGEGTLAVLAAVVMVAEACELWCSCSAIGVMAMYASGWARG